MKLVQSTHGIISNYYREKELTSCDSVVTGYGRTDREGRLSIDLGMLDQNAKTKRYVRLVLSEQDVAQLEEKIADFKAFLTRESLREKSSATTSRLHAGEWRVLRDCCSSGNCIECNGKTPVGTPMRVVQMDNVDRAFADRVAANWRAYRSEVVHV